MATQGSDDEPAAVDLLEYLMRRYSIGPKHLRPPSPSRDDLLRAAGLALRAPDHEGLQPFRFVVVRDRQRDALAGLFADAAARRGGDPAEVERARARAHNGPGLIALVGRIRNDVPDVPPQEQWVSIGAGLMNFLNALHLLGYGAKTLSGRSVREPAIAQAFCRPGEQLVAWIVAGTPARSAHAKRSSDPAAVLSDWQADGPAQA